MSDVRFALFVLAAVYLLSGRVSAQPEPEPVAETAGPTYFDLRYDEDFSYLSGDPGSYNDDFFDPIKNIVLGEGWTLSLGGEYRFRLESESNKAFGLNARTNDVFTLHRFLLHLDIKYDNWFRVFAQGVHAFDEDRDLAPRGTDENEWDLHQLFVDFHLLGDQCPLVVRIGRQELTYGNIRYVTSAEWDNVRQRFDAVKLFAHGESWDVDLWYGRPVVVEREQEDGWDEDVDYYGLYATYKGWAHHTWDFYFFGIDDSGNAGNPNGNAGDRDIYTLGSRFASQHRPWDFEAELAGQWGHWAGDTIQGWSWSVYGGYTFESCPWTPRLGAGFDFATGDDNPTDDNVGTFNQLFGDGHAHFGALDLVGRQNITSTNVGVTMWPITDKLKAGLNYFVFWLNEEEDALYNNGGAATLRDPTGNSGQELGHELDLTLSYQIDPHSAVLFGWSHFFDDNFIHSTVGGDDDPDFVYLQYQFKF